MRKALTDALFLRLRAARRLPWATPDEFQRAVIGVAEAWV
jgi:hypothetical protein